MQYPRLLILAAVVVVVAALYLAQAVLVPVALAIFLSFVLSPLVSRFERWHLGRIQSVAIVTLFAFIAIGSVSWIVGQQAMNIVTRLPEYRTNLDSRLALVREKVQGPLKRASDAVHQIERSATGDGGSHAAAAVTPPPAAASVESSPISSWATISFGSLLSVLGMAGVIVLLVIIMLVQRGDVRDRFIALASSGGGVVTTHALDEAARRVSRYLLVLTVINASYGTAICLGLWLIGIPNSLLWGILAGVLRFIPYIGPCIAAAIPILFSFAVGATFMTPLATCGLFVAFELLTNMVVEPMVLPNQIGVSTTALVVSAVFWTWLWGAPGLVLATPLTVCVAVMGKHIPRMRFLSVILGDVSVLSPSLRIYQRLLVGDVEDAWSVIAAELRGGKSVVEVCDALLVPAICLAQQDRQDHVIDETTLEKVNQRARELAEELSDRGPKESAPKAAALDAAGTNDRGSSAADAAAAPADVVPAEPLRIVCVAAEKESDAVAASMIADLLRRAGCSTSEVPSGMSVNETLGIIGSMKADAVCLSQIPPLSLTRLRHVCKRIAQRFPGMPILVGTWTMSLDPANVQARLESGGPLQVAATLVDMLAQVERIAMAVPTRSTSKSPMPSEPPPTVQAALAAHA